MDHYDTPHWSNPPPPDKKPSAEYEYKTGFGLGAMLAAGEPIKIENWQETSVAFRVGFGNGFGQARIQALGNAYAEQQAYLNNRDAREADRNAYLDAKAKQAFKERMLDNLQRSDDREHSR